ncbi:hypothetical protein [His 1 virus]|uniref:Uncharacterized protein ORF33 n=1 Tax=His1 virus (isolate Australia/Victoria) TaxID=654912 RepID=Y033_HIS1I|nr:hypothetical protein His1V_gp33 [His 1 virus]Q25BG2.1 RecName: Full=Uncharacterized protein ORF33 [His1 virus (isolate Victoria)]AAQ13760.1 hypothetical protein [His 1 virus]
MIEKGQEPKSRYMPIAFILEVYYTIFGPSIYCPECNTFWRGFYSQHMKYCHFCQTELQERKF